MQTTAKLRHLRQSPRKVRLVIDVIRGMDVEVAQNQLKFMNRRASHAVLKLLNSAIANAENNQDLKRDNLFIKEIKVDEGPALKRWVPRAFGRASAIRKRTSHITIILEEKIPTEDKKDDKKKKESKEKIDTKVVKSLDDIKSGETTENIKAQKAQEEKKEEKEEHKPEPVDTTRMGTDRNKQHLDTVRKKKERKGWKEKMFRRKAS